MKGFIMALILLLSVPTVSGLNVSCDWDYDCSNGVLHRISDCTIDNETIYIDEGLNCEFGCDEETNQCKLYPQYETIILFVILLGSFVIARWVWVSKKKGGFK